MKKYRLLKDLPTFKAGDIFELRTNGLYLIVADSDEAHWKPEVMAYHKVTLDRFPKILKEWFEEIKSEEYWCIDWTELGVFVYKTEHEDRMDDFNESIGNYFKSKEEAERAIKKLKAWKRLKDKGFRFKGCRYWDIEDAKVIEYELGSPMIDKQVDKDLDLLFGGEK